VYHIPCPASSPLHSPPHTTILPTVSLPNPTIDDTDHPTAAVLRIPPAIAAGFITGTILSDADNTS